MCFNIVKEEKKNQLEFEKMIFLSELNHRLLYKKCEKWKGENSALNFDKIIKKVFDKKKKIKTFLEKPINF